jgi:hypothetical protein
MHAASPVPLVSASIASSAAGKSVKTGQQYSSATTISSLMPPIPLISTTPVPSAISAIGWTSTPESHWQWSARPWRHW